MSVMFELAAYETPARDELIEEAKKMKTAVVAEVE